MAKQEKQSKEKPLDKMTANELRDVAKEIPGITGVHGMNKAELIAAIKEERGIKDEKVERTDSSVREIKQKIRALKAERKVAMEGKDKKMATTYRRRISRLKKKTRRAA